MTKVILQVYPSLGNPTEMLERRPIGRDNEMVQRMLDGLVEVARAADELGYWAITHVEHHFHSEGLEYSPSPLMLNVWLANHTKRIKHGQLGLVVTAHDPIRLAEEIALADHLTRGRLIVGLARGYQARWMSTLGQKYAVTATLSDGGEVDQANRELFKENFKIMKLAWESELLNYKGPTYQVPYPVEGVPNWGPAKEITAPYGVPGEVDADGTVKGVSVVPKPLQQPHPKLFQAFGGSPATLTWCGEEDVAPTIFAGPVETLKFLADFYVQGAASRGRNVPLGHDIGICRSFYIVEENGRKKSADSVRAQIYDAYERTEKIMYHGWYEQFGALSESLRLPGEEGPVPRPDEYLADRLLTSKYWVAGTVDDVKREVESLLEAVPADYLVWLFHWGIVPREEGLRQLELFATEIMPEFGLDASALEQAAGPSA